MFLLCVSPARTEKERAIRERQEGQLAWPAKEDKGTLDMRPVFHRKETRVETHIFLCVLAYHLQAAIEHLLQEAGDHTSWETLRDELSTHHVATGVMPTADGRKLAIRRGSIPEQRPREIYRLLGMPGDPMKPIRTWV